MVVLVTDKYNETTSYCSTIDLKNIITVCLHSLLKAYNSYVYLKGHIQVEFFILDQTVEISLKCILIKFEVSTSSRVQDISI